MTDHHDSNDPVAVYLREVSTVEPLTTTEEAKLFRELCHSGNPRQTRQHGESPPRNRAMAGSMLPQIEKISAPRQKWQRNLLLNSRALDDGVNEVRRHIPQNFGLPVRPANVYFAHLVVCG